MANSFTNYSPSGAPMPSTLPLLNDGGVWSFASFTEIVIEPMIDGIGLAQTALGISSTPVTRIVSVQWNTGEVGEFAFAAGTNYDSWIDAVNTGSRIQCAITEFLPHGCTLHSVTVYVDPAAHAALPAVVPHLNVTDLIVSTNTASGIGSADDTSANAGAYQVYHGITASAIDVVIDRSTKAYFLGFISESGANSAANLELFGRVALNYSF